MMLRKTTGFALILTFISLRASIANAGILWSVSEVARAGSGFPGEFIFPETGLNEFLGWRSFQIDVRTDNGDVITAVDVRFRGAFHQRRVDTDFDGVPDAPTPVGSPANSRGDSHLTPAAGALVGSAPTEDSNGHPNFTSPLPGDAYGVGTFMAGAWGIPGANQTDLTPLAYVVLPAYRFGSVLNMELSVATGSGEIFEFVIPEPSSLLLTCLGIALFSRRTRPAQVT